MTEQDALRIIQNLKPGNGKRLIYPAKDIHEAISTITDSLKELQTYREMEARLTLAYGKHDNLLAMVIDGLCVHEGVDIGRPYKSQLLTNDDVDDWEAYRAIGTVKECRDAMYARNA